MQARLINTTGKVDIAAGTHPTSANIINVGDTTFVASFGTPDLDIKLDPGEQIEIKSDFIYLDSVTQLKSPDPYKAVLVTF